MIKNSQGKSLASFFFFENDINISYDDIGKLVDTLNG